MRLIFCLFFPLLLANAAAAQVTASARVDSAELLLGDQVRLHVEVRHPKGAVVSPPNLEGIKMDTVVEFLEQGNWDTTHAGSAILLRRELTFIVWDTGRHRVPSIPFAVFQGNESDSVFTPAIQIRVDLPPVDTMLNDIKPIIAEPTIWQDYLPYLGVLLAVLIVLWLVYVARKKKKEVALAPPPPVVLQPHEIALQKLEALKNKQLWQAGQVKIYHSELTYIVREYLEKRFGILALENTTDEILASMKKREVENQHLTNLRELLQVADLVKFAKAKPAPTIHDAAADHARGFILATQPAFGHEQNQPTGVPGVYVNETGQAVATYEQPRLPAQPPTGALEIAGFWRRFFARFIDLALWIPVFLLIATVVGLLFNLLGIDLPKASIQVISIVLLALFTWFYFGVLEHWKGGTIGKLLLGIRTTDLQGNRLTLGRATVRFLGKILISETILLLGYLLYFVDKTHRQTLHDKMAGSIVVRKRKGEHRVSAQILDVQR